MGNTIPREFGRKRLYSSAWLLANFCRCKRRKERNKHGEDAFEDDRSTNYSVIREREGLSLSLSLSGEALLSKILNYEEERERERQQRGKDTVRYKNDIEWVLCLDIDHRERAGPDQ